MLWERFSSINPCLFVGLKDEIRKVCAEEYLVCGEGDEQGAAWMEKVCINKFLYDRTSTFDFSGGFPLC